MSKLEFESIEECSKFLEGETFIYNDVECVVLSDAEECYVLGYKKAVDKACEWMKLYILNHDDIDIFEMETTFKNELMEE